MRRLLYFVLGLVLGRWGIAIIDRMTGTNTNRPTYSTYHDWSKPHYIQRTSYSPNNSTDTAIIFKSRADALAVLDKLQELLDEYGSITVADYKDESQKFLDIKLNPLFIDNKYGWKTLSGVVVRVKGMNQYYIDLPASKYLD